MKISLFASHLYSVEKISDIDIEDSSRGQARKLACPFCAQGLKYQLSSDEDITVRFASMFS